MASQQQLSSDSTAIDDLDAIAATIQLYIDGVAQGDTTKLADAFHPDAQMYGAIGEQRFDMPISEFFEFVDGHPADVDGTYRARITSLVQTDDAASVALIEESYMGTLSFADFFTLCRNEGRWRIVNKTFAHTGGEMPVSE